MVISQKHVEDFLRKFFRVDNLTIKYDEVEKTLNLSVRTGSPLTFDHDDICTLMQIFRGQTLRVPAWEEKSKGCDTCGHGAFGLIESIKITHPIMDWDYIYREVALLKWSQEEEAKLAAEKARVAAERRRAQESQRKAQARALEKSRLKAKKEFEAVVTGETFEKVFTHTWGFYLVHSWMSIPNFCKTIQGHPLSSVLIRWRKDAAKSGTFSRTKAHYILMETVSTGSRKRKRSKWPKKFHRVLELAKQDQKM